MAAIQSVKIFATDLPFRQPFRHSAAERSTSNSLFLKCTLDSGEVGFGESLPREYVTGESRDSAFEMLKHRILPNLVGKTFEDFDAVRAFLNECDGKAPAQWVDSEEPQTAAWCAIDLMLHDAFGREFEEPILSKPHDWPNGLRYSGVTSADKRGWSLFKTALKLRLFGLKQVKVKVDRTDGTTALTLLRQVLGKNVDIRVDANMLWDRDTAITAMKEWSDCGVHSFEQPTAADDIDGLATLVRETSHGIMVDESLSDRDSMAILIDKKACTAVNVRISKCGGLIAAHARCLEALKAGLVVQIGCQVGESSLLSAAQLALVGRVPQTTYLEGCFGLLLLREDPVRPVLQFGHGGRPPTPPAGYGLAVTVNEEVIEQYTSKSDFIE